MTRLTVEIPEEAFAAMRRSPDEFAREMRLAAGMLWYARGDISQEEGARIAGLDRTEFILALAREKIDVIHVDLDELKKEWTRV